MKITSIYKDNKGNDMLEVIIYIFDNESFYVTFER
jgi:hypothetical protein